MQTNSSRVQATACIFCNVKRFCAYTAAWLEKISTSKIRKQREAPQDFVYTPSCICHLFTKAVFYMYFGFYR